ncbi:MAG: hypothetical protein GY719_21860 [bacterium]|nr:hypothetical protein [bacterium]
MPEVTQLDVALDRIEQQGDGATSDPRSIGLRHIQQLETLPTVTRSPGR